VKTIMTKTLFALLALALMLPAQGLNTQASKDDWEEINFEFNSAVLSDGFPSLLRLAELLSANPEFKVKLDGHTDSVGGADYNQKLGQRRAEAVRAFLIKYNVRPAQIELVSRGKVAPKVDNTTREGRFMNRRVGLSVLDAQGRTIGAGGIADAIKTLQQHCPDYSQTLNDILKRLDDIARMLGDLKGENAALRKELDGLKTAAAAQPAVETVVQKALADQPKAPAMDEIARAMDAAIEKNREPRFAILGMNLGADQDRNVTFQGRARYFAPFREKFAFQAQGEYFHFRDRSEGQFDAGLVSRFTRRGQAGLFSSFKHVDLKAMQSGGTLGQASMTLDYIFSRGRVGFFGTKAFLNNAVINRALVSRNILEESYLRVVDQAGGSGAVTLFGNTALEGHLGWLAMKSGGNKPGGTLRLVQPVSDRVAVTIEGGWNETMVATGKTYGRLTAGLQFGNYMQPKEYLGFDKPIPVDIPRVRYEMLTRRVRTGNDAPVADAGPDQLGIQEGQVTVDGSGSYDPDGDPITYQWDQVSGPPIALTGRNTARAVFTAAQGAAYSFRLTVKDDQGSMSIARTTVTTRSTPRVVIQRFTATPATIQPGGASTLTWQVLNAETVEITDLGSVDPSAGASEVRPAETKTYRLTARNAVSEVSENVTVVVQQPAVRIVSFRAAPASIRAGEGSNLIWETENAETVTISGIGNVSPTGTAPVSPTETTTYTLTATNRNGSVSSTATITVTAPAAPRILNFTAAPQEIGEGESSRLSWEVQGATEVNITDIGDTTLRGSSNVTPAATKTYILVAKNPGGEATASVTVTVIPNARIISFTATPGESARPGDPVRLSWQTTGATEVTISGIGAVAANGSVDVNPAADTTYTLTARGPRNTETRALFVKVNDPTPPPPPNQPPTIIVNVPDSFDTLDREHILDASGSFDPNGDSLTFQWRQLGANNQNNASIITASSPTTRVQLQGIFGEYVFELTVTDSKGASSTKTIRIRFVSTRVL
jgi:regulator of replication initiation timing